MTIVNLENFNSSLERRVKRTRELLMDKFLPYIYCSVFVLSAFGIASAIVIRATPNRWMQLRRITYNLLIIALVASSGLNVTSSTSYLIDSEMCLKSPLQASANDSFSALTSDADTPYIQLAAFGAKTFCWTLTNIITMSIIEFLVFPETQQPNNIFRWPYRLGLMYVALCPVVLRILESASLLRDWLNIKNEKLTHVQASAFEIVHIWTSVLMLLASKLIEWHEKRRANVLSDSLMRTSYALMWRIPVLLILCTMSASSIYFTAADALVPDWMSACMINGLTSLFWQVDSLVVLTAIRLAPPNVEQVTATAAYPAYIPRPALPVVPITADSIRR